MLEGANQLPMLVYYIPKIKAIALPINGKI